MSHGQHGRHGCGSVCCALPTAALRAAVGRATCVVRRQGSSTRVCATPRHRQSLPSYCPMTDDCCCPRAINRASAFEQDYGGDPLGSVAAASVLWRGFSRDLRLAARRLFAAPLFSIFAVLSLAVGVGVTTAVYSSVVDPWMLLAVLFQPRSSWPPSVPVICRRIAQRALIPTLRCATCEPFALRAFSVLRS